MIKKGRKARDEPEGLKVIQASFFSWQAYVNQFKFQSITADDALNFYLEYFPELKKRGVDTIPSQ